MQRNLSRKQREIGANFNILMKASNSVWSPRTLPTNPWTCTPSIGALCWSKINRLPESNDWNGLEDLLADNFNAIFILALACLLSASDLFWNTMPSYFDVIRRTEQRGDWSDWSDWTPTPWKVNYMQHNGSRLRAEDKLQSLQLDFFSNVFKFSCDYCNSMSFLL